MAIQALVQHAQGVLGWQLMALLSVPGIRLSKALLVLADVLAFLTASVLATALANRLPVDEADLWLATQDPRRYWAWGLIVLFGLLVFLVRHRHYSDRKPFWTELGEVLRVVAVLAVLDLALLALTRWNASRLWWALVWPLVALCLPIMRGAARAGMRRLGWWLRPTVVVGVGANALEAVAALRSEPGMGFDVVGFVQPDPLVRPGPDVNINIPHQPPLPLWPVTALASWARVPGAQFVLALEHGQNHLREDILRQLVRWRAEDVSVIPAMRGVPLYGTDMSYFFSHEVALLKLRNNLRYWPARWLKRAFDVVAAACLIALLSPLLAWVALRIRSDGGPAIFAHKRVGRAGREFRCFKFRTMCVDAEKRLRELLASDPAAQAEWDREFKLRNDPRITAVGHFLRRTSLDELPQLFNVIRGDMSLVGPRPVIRAELERYGDDVDYFLMVRPGMTGLWQVSGRNDVDYDTRVYLDTWYVKNWSLWYDIAILFKTVKVVMAGRGAY